MAIWRVNGEEEKTMNLPEAAWFLPASGLTHRLPSVGTVPWEQRSG